MSGTLQYLHIGRENEINVSFTQPLKNTITKIIESLAQRLTFNSNSETSSNEQSKADVVVKVISEEKPNP